MPPKQAADSWFVGYQWSILVCGNCMEGEALHLGWKFTAANGDAFYALIVAHMTKQRAAEANAKIGLMEGLKIGRSAPAWLLAMMATQSMMTSGVKTV